MDMPPTGRGCRVCGKIGHKQKECPERQDRHKKPIEKHERHDRNERHERFDRFNAYDQQQDRQKTTDKKPNIRRKRV